MAKDVELTSPSKWRGFFVWLLITIGCLATAGLVIVRWTEKEILTTDNWVAIVSPIPKDDQVAQAVSTYAVGQLFESIDIQAKVKEALPERADFLAPTLTSTLTSQTQNVTKKFIQSDQFQNIWESANRLTHARLIGAARDTTPPSTQRTLQVGNTKFNLDLPSLKSFIGSQLQSNSALTDFQASGNQQPSQIVADLKLSLQNFKRFVRTTDALYQVLPFFVVTSFLLALAIALKRHRALLGISIGLMLVTTLQIIGIKILRPEIINQVQNNLYRPAASVVFDALVNPFNALARNYFLAGLILGIITILFGPYKWTIAMRQKLKLTEIKKAAVFNYIRTARGWVRDQKRYIWIGAAVLTLIYLAFASNLDWIKAAQAIMLLISFGSLVELFSSRRVNTKLA